MKHQAGLGLLELSIALALTALVVYLAFSAMRIWPDFLGASDSEHLAAEAAPRVRGLQQALRSWFELHYCSGMADPLPMPLAAGAKLAANSPAREIFHTHLFDGGDFLDEEVCDRGAFSWQVSRSCAGIQSPAHAVPVCIEVFWAPPKRHQGHVPVLMKTMNAQDGGTSGSADTVPVCVRGVTMLAWRDVQASVPRSRREDLRRGWLKRHGVDCDTNRDSGLDSACDSDNNDDLGPATWSSEEMHYLTVGGRDYLMSELDSNRDGDLDFDSDNNLRVDATDHANWGC